MSGRSMGLRRAFVAVVPPMAVLDAIEPRVAPMRAGEPELRWARRDQWHVTLRFLGAVADTDALVAAVQGALCDAVPISVRLGTAGAFPNAGRASVVWVGIHSGVDGLVALAGAVTQATAALAPDESRPFRPHLTLARPARPRDVGSLLRAFGEGLVGPVWVAGEVVVMESDARAEGAVYREVARVPLGTDAGM